MSSKLDEAEWKLDCLNSRMDALCELSSRADAAGKSGTIVLQMNDELDLGRLGFGEIEYSVAVVYKVEMTPTLKSIKGGDWTLEEGESSVARGKWPMAAIEKAIQRRVEQRRSDITSEVMEKL